MKNKIIITCFILSLISVQAYAQLTKVTSQYDFETSKTLIKNAIKTKGLHLIAEIDHQKGAISADMELQPTYLIIFGNPAVGTQLMYADRAVALDLPLKIVIWEEDKQVYIGYSSPKSLLNDYKLDEVDGILNKMENVVRSIVSEVH